jgi:hypothetical protein
VGGAQGLIGNTAVFLVVAVSSMATSSSGIHRRIVVENCSIGSPGAAMRPRVALGDVG